MAIASIWKNISQETWVLTFILSKIYVININEEIKTKSMKYDNNGKLNELIILNTKQLHWEYITPK